MSMDDYVDVGPRADDEVTMFHSVSMAISLPYDHHVVFQVSVDQKVLSHVCVNNFPGENAPSRKGSFTLSPLLMSKFTCRESLASSPLSMTRVRPHRLPFHGGKASLARVH